MSTIHVAPEAAVAAAGYGELPPRPNIDHLLTEDGTPVDSIFSEKQMRLLTEPLYTSWQPQRPFVALANVGLYYALYKPAIVPDVLLSMDVRFPADINRKENRCYLVWEYGKTPDVAIEVVSTESAKS